MTTFAHPDKIDKMETEEPKDDEDELAALMVASTTVRKRKLEVGSAAINTKRRKQLKDLAVLAPSDHASQKEREQNFASNYYNKLKEQLDEESFKKIIKLLSEFNDTSEGVIDLFKEMSTVLSASLAEEFLCFLTPAQAHLCGKFMDHLILSKMIDFFRKFEISFAKQPQMVRKFYDVLVQLSSSRNVSLQQVRDAVLPLLKGKTYLMEYFLQLFPGERPPDSIVLDDFEEIHLDGDCGNEEEIRLGDTDDAANCPCSCHPAHATHCQQCSVKYINGRVYIQIGKVLRSARVEFNGINPMDALRRVCVNSEELTPKAKPSRRRPDPHQKDHSPVKAVSSPHMVATESEDESGEQRTNNLTVNKPKSARSLKLRFKSSEKLQAKSKVPKTDETSGEIRIITDENAIADTPDCFLARKLSPLEFADGTGAGFNSLPNENQTDFGKQGSLEGPLNFIVHSPLKKKSVCSDSSDMNVENKNLMKMDQKLLVPLKRLEDDDELLISLNNKAVSLTSATELSIGRNNFIVENTKPRFLNSQSSMSEKLDSMFPTTVDNEMNLLLGSSSADKIEALNESNSAEMNKSSHSGVAKYSEPTIDSMSIDSLLNISNLDAKIDSLLTSAEGNKQLNALLNDSSVENVVVDENAVIDKNESVQIKDEKDSCSVDGMEIAGSNSLKSECHSNRNNGSSPSLMNTFKPGLVIGNMDSLLNLSDSNLLESKLYPSVDLVKEPCEESPRESKDFLLKENVSEEGLSDCILKDPVPEEQSHENGSAGKSTNGVSDHCNLLLSDTNQSDKSELKTETISNNHTIEPTSVNSVSQGGIFSQVTNDVPSNGANGNPVMTEPSNPDLFKRSPQNIEVVYPQKNLSNYNSESSSKPSHVPVSLSGVFSQVASDVPLNGANCNPIKTESSNQDAFKRSPKNIEVDFPPKNLSKDNSESNVPSSPLPQNCEESSEFNSVQSILFTCGETCDKSNKVTLFAAETTNEGTLENMEDLVSVPTETKTGEGSDGNKPFERSNTPASEESAKSTTVIDIQLFVESGVSNESVRKAMDKSEPTAPSETQLMEESSLSKDVGSSENGSGQNRSISDSSPNPAVSPKDQRNGWTMEEDKIILQTFQKDPDMEDIFSKIKTQLPERSLQEVQNRFYVLIELMEKMSHDSEEADKKKE